MLKGEDNNDGNVPILPEEDQLPIYVLEADITFTCVGNVWSRQGNSLWMDFFSAYLCQR
jgi:hypothetical protein